MLGIHTLEKEGCCIVGFRSSVGREDSESIRQEIVNHLRSIARENDISFSVQAQMFSLGECDYYFIRVIPEEDGSDFLFPKQRQSNDVGKKSSALLKAVS